LDEQVKVITWLITTGVNNYSNAVVNFIVSTRYFDKLLSDFLTYIMNKSMVDELIGHGSVKACSQSINQ